MCGDFMRDRQMKKIIKYTGIPLQRFMQNISLFLFCIAVGVTVITYFGEHTQFEIISRTFLTVFFGLGALLIKNGKAMFGRMLFIVPLFVLIMTQPYFVLNDSYELMRSMYIYAVWMCIIIIGAGILLNKAHIIGLTLISEVNLLVITVVSGNRLLVGDLMVLSPIVLFCSALTVLVVYQRKLAFKKAIEEAESKNKIFLQLKEETDLLKSTQVSKTFLENIIGSMHDSLIVIDPEFKITSINKATSELLGYNEEDMKGKDFSMVCSDCVNGRPMYRMLVTDRVIQNTEKVYLAKNGNEIPVLFSCSGIHSEGSNLEGFVCTALDITELKRIENALREYEDRWRSLTENTNDVIVFVDEEFNIEYINRTIPPATVEEVIGTNIYDYVLDEFHPLMKETFQKVYETGEQGAYEIALNMDNINPELEPLVYHSKVVPVKRDDGTIEGLILVTSDTTARKKNEEDMMSAKIEAERASKAKSEFLANMSHELRTPMNGILGLTDMLLKYEIESLNEEQIQWLELIHTSGIRLLNMLNSILDISKVEAGRMEIERNVFSVSAMLKDVNQLFDSLVKSKFERDNMSINLLIEKAGDVPDYVISDEKKLRQILVNLIGNAVKFTEEGEISLSVREEDDHLAFEVKDSGIGIEAEYIDAIFEKFKQVDGSMSRKYQGTGLGLSLCKEFVTMLGGEIVIESQVNVGTTIHFDIPYEHIE